MEKIQNNKNIINIDDTLLKQSEFIGYDKHHNSYWRSLESNFKYFIIVYSYYGEIIDAFYFNDLMDLNALNGGVIHTAIASNGDVYYMRNDENGSHFYKTFNAWDPM